MVFLTADWVLANHNVVPGGTDAVALSFWDEKETRKPMAAQPIHRC